MSASGQEPVMPKTTATAKHQRRPAAAQNHGQVQDQTQAKAQANGQAKTQNRAAAKPAVKPVPEHDTRESRKSSTIDMDALAQQKRQAKRIGDYQLMREIGQGGKAKVYAARQRLLDRIVALKVLRSELCQKPHELVAFKREAANHGKVDHPNIVTCFQAGADGRHQFIALAYAERGTAAQVLNGSKRSKAVAKVLTWLGQLAGAVQHCHDAGVVHADIKQGNIFIHRQGYALLGDLGIMQERARPFPHGPLMGTPVYMAPEQARRENMDVRTDIYALGCTAYHLLTGIQPFAGENPQAIFERLRRNEEPVDIAEVAPWLPGSVQALIRRCMFANPERRFIDGNGLALALAHVAQGLGLGEAVQAVDPFEDRLAPQALKDLDVVQHTDLNIGF